MSSESEIQIQRDYYKKTARLYNSWHLNEHDAHYFSLTFLISAISYHKFNSLLDVGSGTGRALLYLNQQLPTLKAKGIEPVAELREEGFKMGIPRTSLIEGDATSLQFDDNSFDVVTAFGTLHHIKHPDKAISEMLRVAGKAIFISDANNFGQGSFFSRTIKQCLNAVHLWGLANWIKNGGKNYMLSEADGLAYSYSIFNDYRLIKSHCSNIHLLNTEGKGYNFYRSAGHVALLGLKKQS